MKVQHATNRYLSSASSLAVKIITAYREHVSAGINTRCRFERSCSAYGLESYKTKGFLRATILTAWRILRCSSASLLDRGSGVAVVRRGLLLAFGIAMVVGSLLGSALPAQAEITQGCSASINGVDVAPLSSTSPNDAIPVKEHTSVTAAGQSAAPISSIRVSLEFGGFRWKVSDQPSSGNSWQSSVAIDQYAKYGVGLYKVVAQSSGPGACVGSALVNVAGNPLGTIAGKVGAVTAAAGFVGMAYTSARAARAGGTMNMTRDEYEKIMGKTEEVQQAERNLEEAKRIRDEPTDPDPVTGINHDLIRMKREAVERAEATLSNAKMQLPRPSPHAAGRTCVGAMMPALLLTLAAMMTLSTQTPLPPRVRWKPRISFLGLISGVLFGLGSLVLAQQYAFVFPTRTIAIVWIITAVLMSGAVLPSLFRIVAVKRINRKP